MTTTSAGVLVTLPPGRNPLQRHGRLGPQLASTRFCLLVSFRFGPQPEHLRLRVAGRDARRRDGSRRIGGRAGGREGDHDGAPVRRLHRRRRRPEKQTAAVEKRGRTEGGANRRAVGAGW